ncbi:hybrid sensor histidine kinase/response regulator [Nodularia spumigena CS-591/04]|uniref:hybrid sensor histidine kinase/response regulator n=1 Tax=Nodularia spumigena TaxID=70799 RepID=UPI00232A8BB2|nr:hybrid sensor histidine kinase/response regulator [Nodularia spumigena]MDB9322360.1 hybrid sensor histidine kinase/response regulator [Nodularia spumigena CS-591/07A]MDB9330920.1 hybrid sensor histidine kinase/response regulator [Nodularia spumigena CS-591/04]MDB9360225.1 hybrid sensor histidine kinase/response regulator [Nodularia spumigena CS-588/02]MDB9366167.1 hybrid sensor histidine kinase/response regulator [Nodularia spumigena CS-588/02A10]
MNTFSCDTTLEARKPSILLVDDSADSLRLLQITLKLKGYNVTVAESGAEALMQITKSPPDLVILDVLMPDMDGYEVTQEIKQNSNIPFIPILLVTGSEKSNVVKGLDAGADEFIRKPVGKEELLARVRALLRLKHSMDEQLLLCQRREDFVTHLTHDLRTPLIAADQYLNLLQRGVFGHTLSAMKESLEHMAQSNQTLLSMVDTLLEVYQYEAGCKTLDFFVVDLWELCQQVVQELITLAEIKQLTLQAVLAEGIEASAVRIRGDRLELRRLLTNLIGNAIRFTDTGSVKIRLNSTCKGVTIEVEDTGIGMNHAEQLHLFERFRQGKHQRRGNGLGLYLSRQIISAHQGIILVSSITGQGSIFTVYLPGQTACC